MHTIQLDADDKQSVNHSSQSVKRCLAKVDLIICLLILALLIVSSLRLSGMLNFYSPSHGWRDATQPSPCGIGHDEEFHSMSPGYSFLCRIE